MDNNRYLMSTLWHCIIFYQRNFCLKNAFPEEYTYALDFTS